MFEQLRIGGDPLRIAIKQNETLVLLTAGVNNLFDHVEILIAECPRNIEYILDSLIDNGHKRAFKKAIAICDKKLAFERAIAKLSVSFARAVLNTGFDINVVGPRPFWNALLTYEFETADFLIKNGLKLAPLKLRLMLLPIKKIYMILHFCHENKVPISIVNEQPEKISEVLKEYDRLGSVSATLFFQSSLLC